MKPASLTIEKVTEDQQAAALHILGCYHQKATEDLVTRFRDKESGVHIYVTADPKVKQVLEAATLRFFQ